MQQLPKWNFLNQAHALSDQLDADILFSSARALEFVIAHFSMCLKNKQILGSPERAKKVRICGKGHLTIWGQCHTTMMSKRKRDFKKWFSNQFSNRIWSSTELSAPAVWSACSETQWPHFCPEISLRMCLGNGYLLRARVSPHGETSEFWKIVTHWAYSKFQNWLFALLGTLWVHDSWDVGVSGASPHFVVSSLSFNDSRPQSHLPDGRNFLYKL